MGAVSQGVLLLKNSKRMCIKILLGITVSKKKYAIKEIM